MALDPEGCGDVTGKADLEMDDHSAGPAGSPDRTAIAEYVAELTGELATLARRHGLDALGYLLDMAQLEASNARRHVNRRR